MIIKPKVRGFVCITSHPEGCAAHVKEQIDYVKKHAKGATSGPKKVLVIGSSTGYGLASRIVSTFGNGAATLGVCFERPANNGRPASAGWYNTAAFEKAAHEAGVYAKTINGDAFSDEIKEKTIQAIKDDLGKV
ncbi:MAG: bifunctional NADH-specific enoyl-ACP reductase/trans-2-enoyl-CoA reductase, partial [Bdellovibrionales bacterium]|nr:bifunctional NADH-specific enoyl-ACP reductase/trans-2-enoyl-CoA reductase [Bdellovibrionales bacterium]